MNNIIIDDEDDVVLFGNNTNYGNAHNSVNQNQYQRAGGIAANVGHSQNNYPTLSSLSDGDIILESGFWAVVGGAPQIIRRSYSTHLDGDTYDKLYEDIDPNLGFSSSNISAITGAMVTQASDDYSLIELPNGISSKRIIFLLKFKRINTVTNRTSYYYLNGYADKVDVSMISNTMAPDTRFYINEIVEIVKGWRHDGHGNKIPFQQLKSCDQIITGGFNPRDCASADHSIRPVDLFQSMRENEALSRHNISGSYNISDSFIFNSSNKFKKSSRINNNPTDYIGRSLKALDNAAGDRFVTDPNSLYETASERLAETSITNDAVLNTLQRRCDIRREGFVELGVLLATFPEMNDPRIFINATQPDVPTYIDSADLTSRAYEISIGKMLATSISAVALKHYLTDLRIHVTPTPPSTLYGLERQHWVVSPIEFKGYLDPQFVTTKFRDFTRELVESVLPSIIPDPDNIAIEFELAMKLIDKTHIDLRINGGEWYPQVYANFCDGIAAPVVASGVDTLASVSSDIVRVYDDFYGNYRFR